MKGLTYLQHVTLGALHGAPDGMTTRQLHVQTSVPIRTVVHHLKVFEARKLIRLHHARTPRVAHITRKGRALYEAAAK